MQDIEITIADGDEHPNLPYVWWDNMGGVSGAGWVVRYDEAGTEMDQGLIAADRSDPGAAVTEAAEFLASVHGNDAALAAPKPSRELDDVERALLRDS